MTILSALIAVAILATILTLVMGLWTMVYGTGEDHYLHSAPKCFFTLWRMQPDWLKKIVPYP